MDRSSEELAAVVDELRRRVRARNPNGAAPDGLVVPDLTPLTHARDAAEGKVASIGTVNPRRGGPLNALIQAMKRLVARSLDWHVREQVEFNRAVMSCVQSTLEALAESNRTLVAFSSAISARIDQVEQASAKSASELREEATQLKDIRVHWSQWRVDWEQKLAANEIHFLRSISDLQAAFHHRVTLMDAEYRQTVREQHANFSAAEKQAIEEIQQRLWSDLDGLQKRLWDDMRRIRTEHEAMIHTELRLLRQRSILGQAPAQTSMPPAASQPAETPAIDWMRFAERFRGSEAAIAARQRLYGERFRDSDSVLDLGCGRGELLEVFRAAGISARGIDLNDDALAICTAKGLSTEKADLFTYLNNLADSSLRSVVCCQVVEHLPPASLPDLIRLLHAKLRAGALLAIETPNPECLAIFSTHFYLDPTHRHPIPAALLSFYLEEAGFGSVEVEYLSPANESIPSVAELPDKFREQFFGHLDYAIFARKLA